jgi:hypothetical protein
MAIIKPITIITITMTKKDMTHKMWYLQLPPRMESSQQIYVFLTVKLVGIIEIFRRVCSILKISKRASRFVKARV